MNIVVLFQVLYKIASPPYGLVWLPAQGRTCAVLWKGVMLKEAQYV